MHNIDPDNHFYNNIPTNSRYYSDQQIVCIVKSGSETYHLYILMLEV